MTEFTPTEEWQRQMHAEVAVAYRMSELGVGHDPDSIPYDADEVARIDAEFDRFLANVRADAWDEAFSATCDAHDVYGGLNYEPRNPYREANDE